MSGRHISSRAPRAIDFLLTALTVVSLMASFLPRHARATPPFVTLTDEQPKALEDDPHFHLLLQNSHIRVFALGLPAKSLSFVRFEHNFLSIELDEGEVIRWKAGESPIQHFRVHQGEIQFFLGDSVRGFRNEARTDEYHSLVVEFLDPGITTYGYRYHTGKWDFGPSLLHAPVDTAGHFVNSLDLQRAVASDVQLLPQESLPASGRVGLLVAISRANLQMGKRQIRLEPGEILWLEGREAELVNSSNDPARLALVELRAATEQY